MDSPIRQLVGQLLSGQPHVQTFHAAAEHASEAVTGSGVGLEPFAGERVLAATSWEERPQAGVEHRACLAITDLRTCVSGWSSIRGGMNGKSAHLLHGALQGVQSKDGMLSSFVKLFGAGGQAELMFPKATRPLAAFYDALTRVHPQHRCPPHTPMPSAGPDDPAGIASAKAGLWREDPDAVSMLDRLAQHVAGGMPADTAADLLHRVVLDHRVRASAPAMRDGRWLSPIPAQDLGHTVCRLLGNPVRQVSPQPGVHQLEFAVTPETGRALGGALTALGVASYVGLGVGYAPGKVIARAMLKKEPVREIQVLFADTGPHAGYRVLAYGSPLEQRDAHLAHQVHLAIGAAAHRVLAARVTHGWNAPFDDLLAPPPAPPRQPAMLGAMPRP